jgi:pSer/pThr/pTyr-binding forkhead associated (FHA) protein
MKLSLVITQGKEQGKAIPIKQAQFLIGRDAQCHLRPASPLVSKRHCALLVKENKAYVRDFGSTNGTFVNDEVVQSETELHNGDRLKIGPVQFIVRLETASAKKPAASGTGTPMPVKAASGHDDDAIAAMLLDVELGEVTAAPSADGAADSVPSGTTVVMPLPDSQPAETQPGQPAEKKKGPAKASGDTSHAAKAILDKYTRRPREK